MSNTIVIKVSNKWLQKRFMCSYDYITKECKGGCCQGSSRLLISLLPKEEEWFMQNGRRVENHLLCGNSRGLCPEKSNEGLCNLHRTDKKPFGCIVSPFTINRNNTLIIRYRYSRLKCFGKGQPAYKVFKTSLDLLFGNEISNEIATKLDNNEENIMALISKEHYNNLIYLDGVK